MVVTFTDSHSAKIMGTLEPLGFPWQVGVKDFSKAHVFHVFVCWPSRKSDCFVNRLVSGTAGTQAIANIPAWR
jgi:hypothetical protein